MPPIVGTTGTAEPLLYAIGLPNNNRLKKKVKKAEKAVRILYQEQGLKHQFFMAFKYKAKSWHKEQQCYAKVESTGIGMNTRHFVSNIPEKKAREIYFDFYVKRGEASENRIKEVKNMYFRTGYQIMDSGQTFLDCLKVVWHMSFYY